MVTGSGFPLGSPVEWGTGVIAQDGNYLYISTAVNTWRRVALSSW